MSKHSTRNVTELNGIQTFFFSFFFLKITAETKKAFCKKNSDLSPLISFANSKAAKSGRLGVEF